MNRKYLHYTGREFELVTTAVEVETTKFKAVYRDVVTGGVWVCSLDEFYGAIKLNGVLVPRFAPVSE